MFKGSPTEQEIEIHRENVKKVHFPSSFNFLKETRGLRPGHLTVLMGTAGSGKSTLLKSIIAETTNAARVLVILSEESRISYSKSIMQCDKFKKENLFFSHEKDFSQEFVRNCKNADLAFMKYKDLIVRSCCKVVFYDNITTSEIYSSLRESEQGIFVGLLSELAENLNISIFCVAHTGKTVSDYIARLITGDDVRGSNQLFMKPGYFYIFQRFALNQNYFTFIRIAKHRDEEDKLHRDFALVFKKGKYEGDLKITHEDINEMFSLRNRLTEKKPKKAEYKKEQKDDWVKD